MIDPDVAVIQFEFGSEEFKRLSKFVSTMIKKKHPPPAMIFSENPVSVTQNQISSNLSPKMKGAFDKHILSAWNDIQREFGVNPCNSDEKSQDVISISSIIQENFPTQQIDSPLEVLKRSSLLIGCVHFGSNDDASTSCPATQNPDSMQYFNQI